MATKTKAKSASTKASAVKASNTKTSKRGAPKGPREAIVTPEKATFDTDDKRAQYARLVIFNFAKSNQSKAKVPKGADVNSVSDAVLTQAGRELAGGTLIKGPEGLDLIMSLSKDGSTTGRPLTKAYAAEVRPFIRRLKLAPSFARRSRARRTADAKAAEAAPAEEAA